jgi:hypothetical protein
MSSIGTPASRSDAAICVMVRVRIAVPVRVKKTAWGTLRRDIGCYCAITSSARLA